MPRALRANIIHTALVLSFLVAAGPRPVAGAETWNVAGGEVRIRCRMTVGGSFDAVTPSLSGTLRREGPGTGAYRGELRVDLATMDTGIELRNGHLRDSYLELDRGPDFLHAVLSGIAVDEPPPDRPGRHETRFSGALSLHGVRRPIEGEAELRRRNGRIQVEARFSLSLDEFDIPPPRYLGIGVRDVVRITVRFDAARDETSPDSGS